MAGMVKATESLLNVVIVEEPKRLTGSSQNGNAPDIPARESGYADKKVLGGKAGPNPV